MGYDYQDLLQNMHDGLYFVDPERRITFWNKAAERITGYSAKEVVGSRCMDSILVHVDEEGTSLCHGLCPLAASIKEGVGHEAELYLHHKDGHRVPVLVRVLPLRDETGTIIGGAEIFSDARSSLGMSEKIQELEKLALLDELTRLSNRRHLDSELESRLQEAERYGLSFGVLFIDVDDFKKLNDNCGHSIGDRVLKTLANTLIASARSFDLFGRWGGEEFVGIIRNADEEVLTKIGNRCRVLAEQSTTPLEGCELRVTVSVGATIGRPGDTGKSIIERADALMYESKRAGKNRLTVG